MEEHSAPSAPTVDELLAELAAMMPQDIDDDETTAGMLADKTGRNHNKCKAFLDGLVAEGKMTARQVICNGRKMTAYRKKLPA